MTSWDKIRHTEQNKKAHGYVFLSTKKKFPS